SNQSSMARTSLEINQFQPGWGMASGALAQTQMAIGALLSMMQGFQRGRRTTQQQRNIVMLGTGDGQVPGVVAQAVLLFEGAVVLLVDDDDPRACQGRENR